MKARTLSAPTRNMATSVAVLSLCAIMASSTVRADAVPVRNSNTPPPTERMLSLIGSCSLSERLPASTPCR